LKNTSERKKDPLDNYDFWINQIKQAKTEAKEWETECKAAWNEYLAKNPNGEYYRTLLYQKNHYPMYWSDTQTLKPAIYSNIPKIIIKQKFSTDDPIARTASLLLERLGISLIELSDFEQAIEKCALEFLNTNRTTSRIFYDSDIKTRTKRIPVYQQQIEPEIDPETEEPLGELQIFYVDENGNQIDEKEVKINEEGQMFQEGQGEEEIIDERIKLKALGYTECLISPKAQNESEIWWKAYKIRATKKEAIDRFGTEKAHLLGLNDKEQKDQRVEYWEVWCKRNKKIYWLSEIKGGNFLDTQDDIYELENFFPSPKFIIDSAPTDSLFPVTDFTQTNHLYNQLHILAGRMEKLSRAIRSRYIFDGAIPELQNLGSETYEAEGLGVAGWQQITDKGGLRGVIDFWPVEDLVRSLNQCQQLFEQYKNQIYELRGIPDVIRGATDAAETAFAQRIKSRYASLRFSWKQRAFARFIADNIRLMVDMALHIFSDDTLRELMGASFLDPEDQERFDQALLLLKSDKQRSIRLDIETDSTVLWVEEEQKQLKAELLQAVSSFVRETATMIKEDKNFAKPMMAVLYNYIKELRQGKEIEDEISQSFNQLLEQLNQLPPEENLEDPKIVAEQMRLEASRIEAEALLIRAQSELQKAQLQSEIAQSELQMKQEALLVEREKIALEYQKIGAQSQIEQIKAGAEQFKADAQIQKEAIDTEQAIIKANADRIKAESEVYSSL